VAGAGPAEAEATSFRVKPAAPRKGEPINDRALQAYLEQEGLKLLKAGKLSTNLVGQARRKACSLELARVEIQRRTPAEIAALAEDSVMVIGQFYLCGRCSKIHCSTATGFVISRSGAMATSWHVLGRSNALGMVAMSRGGRLYPVQEVLAADRANDTVLLQLAGRSLVPLALAPPPPAGSPVTVLSHPSGHYYALSTGVVSRHLVRPRHRGTASFVAVTAPFGAGSSGAPVFDEFGAVIAVVNNTEAVFADHEGTERKDFQISIFNCTSAQSLLEMVENTGREGASSRPLDNRKRW
jgi:S1-C subfamily serine protease